jgi:hypothetical protein
LYGKSLEKLQERIKIAKTKLSYSNFKIYDLSGYDLFNTIKLIFNPYQERISYEDYEKIKIN